MSHQIAFIGLIILTLFWRYLAPIQIRGFAVPWAFAVLLMNLACAAFYWGPIRAAYVLMNYSAYVVMLDGFDFGTRRNNITWTLFLCFWGYMIFSSIYGYFEFAGMFYWLNALLTTFCCGYFVARWVVRTENGMKKLLFAITCTSCITMLLYFKHGSFAELDIDSAGRAGFDMEKLEDGVISNVNYTALVMLMFVPFLVVTFLRTAKCKGDMFVKCMSVIALILCGVTLVRTGARNGAVGLLPSIWYFIFSTTNRIKRRRRIFLLIVFSIMFVPAVMYTMRGSESLRFLDFTGKELSEYGYVSDRISSGRVSMWLRVLDQMTPLQMLVGRGFSKYSATEVAGRVSPGNAHCGYMTVLYNSGFFGLFLMLVFLISCLVTGMRLGDRGRLALLFIGTWFFSMVGESWGMTGGGIALLGGFGIGLLSHRVTQNREYDERMY